MIASIVVLYETVNEDIEHIRDYCNLVDKVIIMDNSSSNNSSLITKIIGTDNYVYEHYPENIGLCKALNKGMYIAKEYGCDWALIMDSDSSFITNIIDVYKKQLSSIDDTVAVLAPVHIHDRTNAEEYEGNKTVSWAMTSGCFFNVDIFMKLGGFMEELFVDGLDIDYCLKAREKGYTVLQCGKAVLKHHPAESKDIKIFGKTILKVGVASPWRYYMQARCLYWTILRYKNINPGIVMYLWKTFKVIFFFSNKKEYIVQMRKGKKEGAELYRKYKKAELQ